MKSATHIIGWNVLTWHRTWKMNCWSPMSCGSSPAWIKDLCGWRTLWNWGNLSGRCSLRQRSRSREWLRRTGGSTWSNTQELMLISLSLLFLETWWQVALELAWKHRLRIVPFTIPIAFSVTTHITFPFPLTAKISLSISLATQHFSIRTQESSSISQLERKYLWSVGWKRIY